MKESELSPYLVEAFEHLDFHVEGEVKFPLTRLDFVASRFNERYLIEVESDRPTMYLQGLRQLASVTTMYQSEIHETRMLVVPKLKPAMVKKFDSYPIFDLDSLKKLQDYDLLETQIHQIETFDALNSIPALISKFYEKRNDENSRIFCILKSGKKEIKIEYWHSNFFKISAIPPYAYEDESGYKKFQERIPEKKILWDEFGIMYGNDSTLHLAFGNRYNHLDEIFEKFCFWIFGEEMKLNVLLYVQLNCLLLFVEKPNYLYF